MYTDVPEGINGTVQCWKWRLFSAQSQIIAQQHVFFFNVLHDVKDCFSALVQSNTMTWSIYNEPLRFLYTVHIKMVTYWFDCSLALCKSFSLNTPSMKSKKILFYDTSGHSFSKSIYFKVSTGKYLLWQWFISLQCHDFIIFKLFINTVDINKTIQWNKMTLVQ